LVASVELDDASALVRAARVNAAEFLHFIRAVGLADDEEAQELYEAALREDPSPHLEIRRRRLPQRLEAIVLENEYRVEPGPIRLYYFTESRAVLGKLYDLGRPRKADRIWQRETGGEIAVIACVYRFRTFVEGALHDVSDVRTSQLAAHLLANVDKLISEMEFRKKLERRRYIDEKRVTEVIVSYRNLREQLYRDRPLLSDAAFYWGEMMKLAEFVWPGQI
jgi:hypothetical protein